MEKRKEKIWFTPKELATRWEMEEQTLANWRFNNKGPGYGKFGKSVRYNIEAIETFERASLVSTEQAA